MKLSTFAIVSLMASALFSCDDSRTIDYPSYKSYGSLHITRIEMSDTATVVSTAVTGYPRDTFSLDSDSIYLQGSQSGRKYMLLRAEGILPRENYIFDNSGARFATFAFEPVSAEEGALDFIVSGDEAFDVHGIALHTPDSISALPVCHLSGRLHDMPDTKVLMLTLKLDLDGNFRNAYDKSRFIEVKDSCFECDIPIFAADDSYELFPWEQFVRNSFSYVEFFAEEGDVYIDWADNATVSGGALNSKAESVRSATGAVYNRYTPLVDSLSDSENIYSVRSLEIFEELKAGGDNRVELYRELSNMSDQEMYSAEYYEIYSHLTEELRRVSDSLYGVMATDVSLGYLPKILNDIQYQEDIVDMDVVELYAERFSDYALGRRLGDHLYATRTGVGGTYIDFEAPDRNGDMHRFSDMMEGSKIVLLDLWASWCSPCRITAKNNKPIYERYSDKGFCVVSVAREFGDTRALDAAVEKDGYQWPVLVELDDRINLWRKYMAGDSGGALVLIDPADGKIIARPPSTEDIERIVKEYCE